MTHPEALHGAADARQLLRLLRINLQDCCIKLADGALRCLLQAVPCHTAQRLCMRMRMTMHIQIPGTLLTAVHWW